MSGLEYTIVVVIFFFHLGCKFKMFNILYFIYVDISGYQSLYKKRTSDEYSDGCAIFFKSDKIVLSEYITVEFKQTGPLLNRNNVAIITKLAPKDNIEQEFVVATTHLLYNPKREDVRLAQVQLLLAEIDRIAFKALVKYDLILICF